VRQVRQASDVDPAVYGLVACTRGSEQMSTPPYIIWYCLRHCCGMLATPQITEPQHVLLKALHLAQCGNAWQCTVLE
jgi:hypothetical protein